jgi:hypothetical protein
VSRGLNPIGYIGEDLNCDKDPSSGKEEFLNALGLDEAGLEDLFG